jgi:putative spermidine/putrescine transport system permease protein
MGEKVLAVLNRLVAFLVLFYMLIPILIIFIVSFNSARFFTFPPREGLSLVHYVNAMHSAEYQSAVRTSFLVAIAAVGISLVVGIPAAFAFDRYDFKIKNFLQTAFLSPLLLPSIIWAIALVSFYARFKASGTFIGMALAHGVLITPYVIRLVLASLAYININLEDAAKSAPGVLISSIFGFMISFTDVVIATFIAGTRLITFPARIYYEQRTEGLDPLAVAVSAFVMAVIVIIAMIGERTLKWSRFM